MIRYQNQSLPPSPRIAVIANDAIGNFVMATPLLQLLRRERTPSRLDYFGGSRTRELQAASDLFDTSFLLHGSTTAEYRAILEHHGRYDLIVNLESTPFSKTTAGALADARTFVAGPSTGPGGRGELPFSSDDRGDLWRDQRWSAEDVTTRYPFLRSGFISEIFCRLCYLEGDLPRYRVPSAEPARAIPELLISTAASLREKLWPLANWHTALSELRGKGRVIGLLGAPRAQQGTHWHGASVEDELVNTGLVEDLRGVFTMPQVVGALAKATGVLTVDNGILHLATAVGTPTVGLYRRGLHRLWIPPSPSLTALIADEGRTVQDISPRSVVDAVMRLRHPGG